MAATALDTGRAVRAVAGRERGTDTRRLENRRLFARRDAGDSAARDALVERFLPLARSLARRYQHSTEPIDDLVQIASLALLKAIDRFDASQGTAFSTFAVPTIVGELKRHFRDRTWTVRPPRALQELTLRLERAVARLSTCLDRAPTVSELAADLGIDEEQILEALQARGGRAGVSLEAPRSGEDDELTLQDTLGGPDDGFRLAESRVLLEDLTAGLSARSREVLRLRFEQDLTQAEIGELIGISQMQVSRLIHGALAHMRLIAAH